MAPRSISRGGWCVIGLMCIALFAIALLNRPAGPDEEGRAEPGRVLLGMASYYGPGFQGEQTASGEVFDQRRMVAAHRTLPLGSVVRVTNLENGRQVTLRVIDRGPYGANYRKGTIIDVSKGAARRLGFIDDGLVRVRVEVLESPQAEQKEREQASR